MSKVSLVYLLFSLLLTVSTRCLVNEVVQYIKLSLCAKARRGTGTTSILYFLIVTVAGRRRHFIIIHTQKVFEV